MRAPPEGNSASTVEPMDYGDASQQVLDAFACMGSLSAYLYADPAVHVAGVVHAWVGQILLKCNEIKRFLYKKRRERAGSPPAAAPDAAATNRRCHGTAKGSVRAITSSF